MGTGETFNSGGVEKRRGRINPEHRLIESMLPSGTSKMNMRRDEHQTQTHSHSPCYQHWVLMRWQRRQDVTGRRRGDSSNLEPGAPGSTGTWTWRKARTPPALGPTVPSKGPSACWTTIRQNHQIMSFYAVDSLLHPQSSRAVMLLLVNILKDLLRTLQVEPPPTQPNRVQPEFFTRMEMRDRRRCCTEARQGVGADVLVGLLTFKLDTRYSKSRKRDSNQEPSEAQPYV
ncbi:uncharacterized protein LOC130519471 [Takifugu flavidus]|uniref:uncharacterized protein LOC130519471 n=1 Tax=Takifugu flavidus TaxID=433684 RepID=UPI0025440F03|nr:uncharacterized protein LOC130519471 [Takifugu flavidus]